MVNPFEETAQAARDWNPREDFISSQGMDQSIQGLIRSHQKNQQRWEDLGRDDPYPTINTNRTPLNQNLYNQGWMEAGITNPNLNGYKVWNAGGPFEGDYPLPGMQWLDEKIGEKYTSPFIQKYISRPLSKLFGNEVVPEEFDPMLNPDSHGGSPVDDQGELLPGWEFHQDGWHYFPPFEGDDQDIVDQFMEDVGPADLGVSETMEAQSKWRGEKALSDAIQLEMNTLGTGDAFEALRSLETKRGGSYPPAAIEIAINLMKGVG